MNDFAIKVLTSKLGQTHIFSVGQAGFIIKSKTGQLFGIDLYLSECVERLEQTHGFKRLLPKILNPFELIFDCLVATHPHYDHFDVDSIPLLMSNDLTKLFASVNCREEVDRLKMEHTNITYVQPGQSFVCGDFKLRFINCDHGEGAPDAVGLILTVDNKNIFFAGDTRLRLDRLTEITEYGRIDLMIAPINGAYGNLNEDECAQLSHALNPKLTIPSHYGMFALHGGNPGLFFNIMSKNFPENEIFLMSLGEQITI